MKTAECEGIETVGALLADARAPRACSNRSSRIAGSHNVKAVVDAGRYGIKTVVCGAPNCRPGVVTAYVPLGKKVIHGVESDGMLASAAELGINQDHARHHRTGRASPARRSPAACPTASSRSTTSPSPTVPICGATTAWRAKWPPSLGKRLNDPVRLDLLPHGRAGHPRSQIEDLDLCPRYSALVFENVTVRPSPDVAAIPADGDRAEPHQQHRRHDQLRDGGAGPAHARLRCRQAAAATPSSSARRSPGERFHALNDEGVHARRRPTW